MYFGYERLTNLFPCRNDNNFAVRIVYNKQRIDCFENLNVGETNKLNRKMLRDRYTYGRIRDKVCIVVLEDRNIGILCIPYIVLHRACNVEDMMCTVAVLHLSTENI